VGEVNANLAPNGFVQWGARSYIDNGGLWVAYVTWIYHVDTQGNKSLSTPDAECVIP
jgi:hypothetical protein